MLEFGLVVGMEVVLVSKKNLDGVSIRCIVVRPKLPHNIGLIT